MKYREDRPARDAWQEHPGWRAERKTERGWRQSCCTTFLIAGMLCGAVGCQIGQQGISGIAGNAGAAFAAASTTLRYFHTGKLSRAYARASFENYQSELSGLNAQLSRQQGSADRQTIARLIKAARPALQAVAQPCLDASCNWRAQVTALDRASQAFLKAGGQ